MKHYWWVALLIQAAILLPINLIENWWTPRFPRAWRGRRVTIVLGDGVQKEKMAAIRRDTFELQSSPYPGSMMYFRFKDEGLTWCFGHEGKQVDALRVAVALESAA